MEMHQVRYFLGVARTLNFTRAAEECHVAQPSLTRAIKQLEDELGGDLFHRERNNTHLTELGQRMLPLLQQCYDSAMTARSLATSLKKGEVATLRLALARSVDIAILIPYLTELRRKSKDLELKFMRGTGVETIDFLKRGEADLAVAPDIEETWDRLDKWPLFTERFSLLVSTKHPLAGRETIELDDLKRERLLMRTYCEQAPQLRVVLKERELDIASGHEIASERDLMKLVEADIGLGLAPLSSCLSDSLRRVSMNGLDFQRTVYVYGAAGRQRSAPAINLLKLLRAADWTRYAA